MRKEMKWKIVALFIGLATGAQAGVLFSDGFDDNTLTNWTSSAGVTLGSTVTHSGSHCAILNGTDELIKEISTVGKTGLSLSYACRTAGGANTYSAGEYVIAEWSTNGVDWVLFYQMQGTAYELVDLPLPAAAENQAGFQFRFRENAASGGKWSRIDTVELRDSSVGSNPPVFTSNPVVEANAEATVAYSGTLADDATDPDDDLLTFTVSPTNTWLNVAENGALSGTPGTNDLGLNSWTVQVSDGTFSNNATLEITVDAYVNRAPAFDSDPFSATGGIVGEAYSDSLVNYASDVESDPMSFTLISPTNSWLSVAADGALSGTPGVEHLGLNPFTVEVAATGGVDIATLSINVGYAGERIALFYDDFESGVDADDFTPGGWTVADTPKRLTAAAYSGTSVQFNGNDMLTKAISTVGLSDLSLSYARRVASGNGALEPGEYFIAEWSTNGTDWILLEQASNETYEVVEWFLPEEAENQAGFQFRFYENADPEWVRIDEVLLTSALPEGGVYTPFAAMADPVNLIANGLFDDLDSHLPDTEQAAYNVLGSFGDYFQYTNRTVNVTDWAPYYEDPNGLTAAVGTPHVVDSDGELDGTFHLDTTAKEGQITLNSSMDYRNGMKQEDILAGKSINPFATYSLSIDAGQKFASKPVQDNATFTFGLIAGADATDAANAVAGALLQTAATNLPTAFGSPQELTVSGAALAAAQSGGPVNVIFDQVNATAIPGFPGSVNPADKTNPDYVSQIRVAGVSLRLEIPENDLNKDGSFDQADIDLAQLYLDGDGGDSAADRQDAWTALGYAPADALTRLNLAEFDADGDGDFDATDIATLTALLFGPQEVVLQSIMTGSGMEMVWSSNLDKTYDLESRTSLMPWDSWVPYNDGVTTYTNISGTVPTNNLIGVQDDGQSVRFFRIIEK